MACGRDPDLPSGDRKQAWERGGPQAPGGDLQWGHLVRLASSLGQLRSRQGARSRQRQGTRLALTHYFTEVQKEGGERVTHFCQRRGMGAG